MGVSMKIEIMNDGKILITSLDDKPIENRDVYFVTKLEEIREFLINKEYESALGTVNMTLGIT